MRKLLIAKLLLLLFVTGALAQNRTVSGSVTDNNNRSPLQGVTITQKGSTNSTQTDAEGKFSISVPANATLIFSFVSYRTVELKVGNNTALNVALQEDQQTLNEVVVTANALKREARSLGYSTTTIRADDLTKGKDRSVLNSLQGKVPGVQITQGSGGVGSSTRIVFRGGTSIAGNNQALIVVDGIPIDNSSLEAGNPFSVTNLTGQGLNNQVDAGNRANDINPEDVESITVLKGPAAAALYGSRASNGALIITTKTGRGLKSKKAQINYSTSYHFESILRFPDLQNEYGQGGQKAPDSRENFSWGPRFDDVVKPWGQQVGDSQKVKPYSALPDNVKEFFDIGHTYTNNISLAQNNETNSYFLSFANTDQKGVMPGTEYKRTSVKLTGTADLSKKFYSSATINYIRSKGDLSVQGQGFSPYDQILQTPRDIPLLELKDYNNKFNDLSGYYGAYTVNPWYYLGEDSYTSIVDRVIGNLQIGYKPVDWVDISYRIGTDVSADQRRQIVSKRIIPDPNNQNFGNAFAGKYEEANYNIREVTSDLIISGKRKINEDLGINILLGHNIRQRSVSGQISTANALVIPKVYNLSNAEGTPTVVNNITLRRLWGIYGSIDLSYKNFLFLGITGRNDWSSTLPEDNRSFFYPSVNAAFVLSDAFNLPDVISYAKLRASAAQVGNDAAPYLLQSVFVTGLVSDGYNNSQVNFPLNDIPGFTQGNVIGNPQLKPEITTSFELGFDVSFFNNRLGLEVTGYSNDSRDQILTVPIAASSGYLSQTLNAGKISNKGIEVLLRAQVVRSRTFGWDITGTFTKNVNEVKELFPGIDQVELGGFVGATLVAKVGEAYGSFFGTNFLRDPNGNIVVNPTTGYPLADPVAKTHGNIQPDYMLGLSNTFSWKGITLTALLDVKKGGVFFSRTKSLQEFVGTSPKTLYNDREPFVIPGSVVQMPDGKYETNTVPVQNAQDYWTNFASPTSIEHLLDASYVKLRELSVSYRLPSSLIGKTPFTDIIVGLSGRNLFLWTPSENTYADPETNSFGPTNVQGFEYGTIPSIRSYGANLRIIL